MVRVFADFDWAQFEGSEKVENLKKLLKDMGLADTKLDIDFARVAAEFKSHLTGVLLILLAFVKQSQCLELFPSLHFSFDLQNPRLFA